MNETSTPCIFCQIIDGSSRCSEVHRDEFCVAFLDINPINPGHILVCSTRHVTSFTELEPQESAAILAVAQYFARIQKRKLPSCSGVNLLLSDGEDAGQEVSHAHFHVIPRDANDGFGWQRSGKAQSRDELDSVAALLLEH